MSTVMARRDTSPRVKCFVLKPKEGSSDAQLWRWNDTWCVTLSQLLRRTATTRTPTSQNHKRASTMLSALLGTVVTPRLRLLIEFLQMSISFLEVQLTCT